MEALAASGVCGTCSVQIGFFHSTINRHFRNGDNAHRRAYIAHFEERGSMTIQHVQCFISFLLGNMLIFRQTFAYNNMRNANFRRREAGGSGDTEDEEENDEDAPPPLKRARAIDSDDDDEPIVPPLLNADSRGRREIVSSDDENGDDDEPLPPLEIVI